MKKLREIVPLESPYFKTEQSSTAPENVGRAGILIPKIFACLT